MVKKIIGLTGMVLILGSCCDYKVLTDGGLRSKYKYKEYLKHRIDPNLVGISTNAIYKGINFLQIEDRERIEPITDPVALERHSFLLFHTNGNCYSFVDDTIKQPVQKNRFNIEKGNINYVIKKKEKYFFMDYHLANCGAFSKWEFEVKDDTLRIAFGHNKGSRTWHYYVKTDIQLD